MLNTEAGRALFPFMSSMFERMQRAISLTLYELYHLEETAIKKTKTTTYINIYKYMEFLVELHFRFVRGNFTFDVSDFLQGVLMDSLASIE